MCGCDIGYPWPFRYVRYGELPPVAVHERFVDWFGTIVDGVAVRVQVKGAGGRVSGSWSTTVSSVEQFVCVSSASLISTWYVYVPVSVGVIVCGDSRVSPSGPVYGGRPPSVVQVSSVESPRVMVV